MKFFVVFSVQVVKNFEFVMFIVQLVFYDRRNNAVHNTVYKIFELFSLKLIFMTSLRIGCKQLRDKRYSP